MDDPVHSNLAVCSTSVLRLLPSDEMPGLGVTEIETSPHGSVTETETSPRGTGLPPRPSQKQAHPRVG
eukprot:3807968-Rhodomonas_salina.1